MTGKFADHMLPSILFQINNENRIPFLKSFEEKFISALGFVFKTN